MKAEREEVWLEGGTYHWCVSVEEAEKLETEIERWRDMFGCDDPQDAVTTTAIEGAELGRRMRSINQLKTEIERLQAEVVELKDKLLGLRDTMSGFNYRRSNEQ